MVLLHDDFNYGVSGLFDMKRIAKEFNVCFRLIQSLNIKYPGLKEADYDAIMNTVPQDSYTKGECYLINSSLSLRIKTFTYIVNN